MSVKQTYRNWKGTLITRVFKDKSKIGRPKGAKGTTYNLSLEGLKKKQRIMRTLLKKLRAEGRTGWPKGVPQPAENCRKNSIGVRRAIAEGRFDPRANIMKYVESDEFEPRSNHGTHGKYYSRKNARYLRYDSSWELIRMKHLEKDASVKSYEKNPVRLVYKIDGMEHYYFPDFLITYRNGDKVLEEIKPRGLAKQPASKAKFKKARLYCSSKDIEFRVLTTQEDLKLY